MLTFSNRRYLCPSKPSSWARQDATSTTSTPSSAGTRITKWWPSPPPRSPTSKGAPIPTELAGELYPKGIPIHAEEELVDLIKKHGVEQVVFAYSDVPHEVRHAQGLHRQRRWRGLPPDGHEVHPGQIHQAGRLGLRRAHRLRQKPDHPPRVPDPARDGLQSRRHPPPDALRRPGQAGSAALRRLTTTSIKHECTIEEREEYEPHIDNGVIVYAGVDYEKIVRQAEKEVDIVLWDGGNNDFPFYVSDLQIVVADPHRPGHESTYHPGETNVRMADVFVINKVDTADAENVIQVREIAAQVEPERHPDRSRLPALRG
ncbi:MAG: hypothetical protein MZV64_17650 [Ignavibacteriales bacterium]|nr:hypothetical protein [Ignavibacteriales bacterium]